MRPGYERLPALSRIPTTAHTLENLSTCGPLKRGGVPLHLTTPSCCRTDLGSINSARNCSGAVTNQTPVSIEKFLPKWEQMNNWNQFEGDGDHAENHSANQAPENAVVSVWHIFCEAGKERAVLFSSVWSPLAPVLHYTAPEEEVYCRWRGGGYSVHETNWGSFMFSR